MKDVLRSADILKSLWKSEKCETEEIIIIDLSIIYCIFVLVKSDYESVAGHKSQYVNRAFSLR